MIAIAKANAIPKPSIGETIISVNVFSTTAITIALLPPAINPELIRPPINAWLLDDGSPNYQVIKSQTIAPISTAKITYTVENSGCIIPFPTVGATTVPNTKGPIKFAMAAIVTACIGFRTRVPTTVAIEFAESWNPFTKSKKSAVVTIL
jgi:hypothetical protein